MRLWLAIPAIVLMGAGLPAKKQVPPEGTPASKSGPKFITPEDVNLLIDAADAVDRRVADAEATHAADKAAQASRDAGQDSTRAIGDAADRAYTDRLLAGISSTEALAARTGALENQTKGEINAATWAPPDDGVTDATTQLQQAITAGMGRRVIIPKPAVRYRITGSLNVESGTIIEGAGGGYVEIQVPAGTSFPVFDVDGRSHVTIRNFHLTKAPGASLTGEGVGVSIRGSAADVLVENVYTDGFVRGFKVAGQDGTYPGTVQRVSFVRCRADNSPSSWGFHVDDANLVLFDDCHARRNWLDGFKLRKRAFNVTVRGGSSNENGWGFLTNPVSYAGDGIDAYAGGDSFLIDGFVTEGNYGAGYTIKTGDIQQSDPAGFGYVRNVQVVNARAVRNKGMGMYLTVSDPLDLTQPLVSSVSIIGGQYEGNGAHTPWAPSTAYVVHDVVRNGGSVYRCITAGTSAASGGPLTTSLDITDGTVHWAHVGTSGSGLYLNARNVAVVGAVTRDNMGHGVYIADRAMDVEITGLVATANGRGYAGEFNGVSIGSATRVRINGGVYHGSDVETVAVDGNFVGLTKYQNYPVRAFSGAVDVTLNGVIGVNHAAWNFPRCDMPAGKCLITGSVGTGLPGNSAYGSLGSTWTRTDATAVADAFWVKTSGAPNAPNEGWQRVADAGKDVFLRGNGDLEMTMSGERTVIYYTPLTAVRTVTLPVSLLYPGVQFRIVRSAAATGSDLLVSDGTSTLKTLSAAGTWCDVQYDGTNWQIVASGTL